MKLILYKDTVNHFFDICKNEKFFLFLREKSALHSLKTKNYMGTIYEFLANGFEDVEALAPLDIMRRANLNVKTVSVTGRKEVETAHHVKVVADVLFEEVDFSDVEMLFLPGGMPGAANLAAHAGLRTLIAKAYKEGKLLTAICAGPMVYGRMGLLKGRKATCYPGFEKELEGAEYTGTLVQLDGPFTTAKGPAASFSLGYAIVERLCGKEKADELKDGMVFTDLVQACKHE